MRDGEWSEGVLDPPDGAALTQRRALGPWCLRWLVQSQTKRSAQLWLPEAEDFHLLAENEIESLRNIFGSVSGELAASVDGRDSREQKCALVGEVPVCGRA